MRAVSLSTAMFSLACLAPAQTINTLPKGWENKEGIEIHSGGASLFWSGWDIELNGVDYNPSRTVYLYDKSLFPWPSNTAKVITEMSVRRDGPYTATATTAHTKDVRLILSTGDQPANAPDHVSMDANHGSNRKDVVGSKGKPKVINFPSTPAPGSGQVAPFNVVFKFDAPFLVPANAPTLVVEMRTYKASVTTGTFRVDCVTYNGAGYNGGSTSAYYNTHCLNPRTFYISRPIFPGCSMGVIWRTFRAANTVMVGWIGPKLAAGIQVPGTGGGTIPQCELWAWPPLLLTVGLTGAFEGGVFLNWGKLPNLPIFVGIQIAHQAVYLDPAINAAGWGITRALETTTGGGYLAANCPGSSTYAFGKNNTNSYRWSGGPVDPDDQPNGRYFFRRVVIWKIN